MIGVPEQLKSVTHPLVSSMYVKKDYSEETAMDVLVIETNYPAQDAPLKKDEYLMALLNDLPQLQAMAEDKIGLFDRIDIRAGHILSH